MKEKKPPSPMGPFASLLPLRKELERAAQEKLRQKQPRSNPPASRPGARSGAPPKGEDDPKTTALGPTPDSEEALLLHRLFAGVKPLDRSRGSRISAQPIGPSPAVLRVKERGPEDARVEAEEVHEHLRALVEGRGRFEVSDDGRRVEGRRSDVSLEVVRQLRRGRLPIDARLDMHGMGIHEARTELESFLRSTRARGERCVLVIHGKGEHSPGRTGILRGEISAWCSQGSASEHIAAFATAQADDGGEGAIYILLRR